MRHNDLKERGEKRARPIKKPHGVPVFIVRTRIIEFEFMIFETLQGHRVMHLKRPDDLAGPALFGPWLVGTLHSPEDSVFHLQEETNNFLKAIEEANKKMQAAEISLEEKDQRIGELDRLIERMEKVTRLGPLAQPALQAALRLWEASATDPAHPCILRLKKKSKTKL